MASELNIDQVATLAFLEREHGRVLEVSDPEARERFLVDNHEDGFLCMCMNCAVFFVIDPDGDGESFTIVPDDD